MNNPEIILFKISICLTLVFSIYYFILRKETTFRFTRFFLLFGLALSVIFPLAPIEIHWSPPEVASAYFNKEQPMPNTDFTSTDIIPSENKKGIAATSVIKNKIPWFVLLYFAGVLIFASRFVINIISLGWKIRSKKIKKEDGYIFIDSNPGKNIHSFFHFIFLPKEQLKKPANSIIEHEKVHAKQLHSVDILVIEFLQIIFWFHPLIYLFKNAIELNHEYLADEHAVKSGKTEYQQSLLEYCIENSQLQFTSGFNFNHIKKRITMMTKQSKKQDIYLKPIAAFVFAALLFAGLSLKVKPVEAVTTEFNTPDISKAALNSDYRDINSNFERNIPEYPAKEDKEIQLKKLMQKRDSVQLALQYKYQKEMQLIQQEAEKVMQELQHKMNNRMFEAQHEMEVAQKSAQNQLEEFQQKYQNKRITPKVEQEYEELENSLSIKMEALEGKLEIELSALEDSSEIVMNKLEVEMEAKMSEIEFQMQSELAQIDREIELKQLELKKEMQD